MTIDFQWELFKFILQNKEGRKYLPLLDNTIFDLPEHQLAFDLLQKYHDKYATVPSRANLLEYFDRASKKANIKKEVYERVDETIRKLYKPFESDTKQIKDSIIEFAQYKKTKKMFQEYSGKIQDGDEVFREIHKEMNKIIRLSEQTEEADNNRGGMLLRDNTRTRAQKIEGHPTYLNSLNKMTAAGGFYSPQLVIIMGAPKSFKTGNLIKMAVEYVRDGYKVYYVDCENGIDSIRNRAKQAMLEVNRQDLYTEDMLKTLDEMIERYKKLGGDMEIDFYPAYTKTVAEVDAELEYLRDEHGWIPDLICWDYPDLMLANDHSKQKDRRLNIQHVYFDIINLNHKWGCFSIGLSQVNRQAVSKAVINMKDFAEDFGKAMNAHAAFAICRTEEEMEAGTARIIPVVQRDGVAYRGVNQCLVEIDEETMSINEISFDRATSNVKRKNIKDE